MAETCLVPVGDLHAMVDWDDYQLVTRYKWSPFRKPKKTKTIYARACVLRDGKRLTIYMHRLIMQVENPKIQVDHINHNGLDNRRGNLRTATALQNGQNQKLNPKRGVSRYKGVSWQARKEKKWQAEIQINGKKRWLGRFRSEEEAALAYNMAAMKHFGEFACLNDLSGENAYA